MPRRLAPFCLALACAACAGGPTGSGHGRGDGHGTLEQRLVPDAGPPEVLPPDLAGADAALRAGNYTLAAHAYDALAHRLAGPDQARAQLGLARTRYETADYDAASDVAAQAAHEPSLRVAALTLRAQALVARGKLDDAEAELRELAGDAHALLPQALLGRLLVARGRRSEATPLFTALMDAAERGMEEHPTGLYVDEHDVIGWTAVGIAAREARQYRFANQAFQQGNAADPQDVDLQLEWAELFLEKNDAGHAEECLRDALAVTGKSPRAHALAARIALAQGFDFEKARAECGLALAVAPGQVDCHVTRAGMALRDMDLTEADAQLARALATNPNDLEALSVKAAVRFLADDADGFDRAKREVLARSPRDAGMYSVIGEYADWEHRYPEIVAMAREAVALDADDPRGYATLGLNLLRMGEETEGLRALQEAWDRDGFDVRVYNTLETYEHQFARDYVRFDAAPLHFRMHREERPALEPYVVPVLRGAYADMVRRYGFTPAGPIDVELFASNEEFSVRTSGLPNVGVQGVCFGKVVTAISPRGGPFNWGNIVWHELSHVFHIQLSQNHVPRWFTEGLAEWETTVAHPDWPGRPAGSPTLDPGWRREDDESLWLALEGGRLPPIADLNQAFTHARREEDILVAYYAASQVVTYVVDRFGFAVAPRMLRAWGEGKRTEQVVQEVLGISVAALDHDFREATRLRLAARAHDFTVDVSAFTELDRFERAATAAPHDADAQGGLAVALFAAGRGRESEDAARRAIALSPRQRLAHWVLLLVSTARHDATQILAQSDALIADGVDGYELRLARAAAAMIRHDFPATHQELDHATRIDGDRPEAWQELVLLARQTSDENGELDAVLKLARIDQHDRPTNARALELLVARQRWAEAVTVGELAIFVDPENADAHRRLGEAYAHTGHAAEGARETAQAELLAHPAAAAPTDAGGGRPPAGPRRHGHAHGR